MDISREWVMPNSKTFKIKPIKEIIKKYSQNKQLIIDPFANESSIKEFLPKTSTYINNDIDEEFDTQYHLEAYDFLQLFDNESVDMVLYDPPYSPRQVSECYKKVGRTVTMQDTQSSYFSRFKKEISRILKKDGICISFGWNTNGIGKTLGFEIVEIKILAHGGMHNDTLVTVERKK